nr:hypothetical protein [Tanacetum cinerariifolium]
MVEETTFLKQDFKQKENKLLADFLNMKSLKEKVEDRIGNNPPTPDKHTPDFYSVSVIGKIQASLQGKDNVIRQLKKKLSQLQVTRSDTDRTLRVQTTDSHITKLTDHVTHLQAQNDLFRAENDKIKQDYKELYDSIKITRAKHIEQVTKLTTKNANLKTCVSKATVNPQVSARDKHAIDVELIIPRLRNNRDAHLDYLMHLKESVETIHDIVEECKVEEASDCCQIMDKSDSTTRRHVVTVKSQKTNIPVPPSTEVNNCPSASGSQPKSHVKANRISPAKGDNKLPVDDQPRKNKSHLRTSNRIDSSSRLKRTHAVDVEPIVSRLRNNREAHLDYLRRLKESVETIRNIVEEAKVVRLLDRSIVSACRVKRCLKASGSQPKSNHKTNRISHAKGANKLPVEDLPRMNKSYPKTTNRVDSSSRLKRS